MKNIKRNIALTALLVLAAGAANAGVCISAGLDEPVRLPGGELHPAGTLKLCLDRDFSPVASLHTAVMGDETLGLMTSRRGTSEGAADQPFMMFVRNDDGILELYGYALPAGDRMDTYLLQSPAPRTTATRVAVDTESLSASRIPAGAR